MKTKLTIILLLCSLWGYGQFVVPQGSATMAVQNKGGFWVDSCVRIPVRSNVSIYPNIPDAGNIQINSVNSNMYYHNGSAFVRLIDEGTYTTFFNTDFSGKTTTDLAEGGNLYFTDSRARNAISLTTTGTGGAATYTPGTGVLNIPVYPGTVTSIGLASSDLSISGSPVTSSGTITANLNASGVSAGTYNGNYTVTAKGVVTAAQDQIDSAETRTFNSAFRPSLTRSCDVNYSVEITTTSALVGNNGGEVFLETSPDNSAWTTKGKMRLQLSGVVSTEIQGGTLQCYVPASYYVRLRTVSTGTNGATFNYITGWKKLY